MKNLTEKEISTKYADIESKIPAQDICFLWDITDGELIRVIALLETRVKGLMINQHVHTNFAFAGLYPNVMTKINIYPSGTSDKYKDLMESSLANLSKISIL